LYPPFTASRSTSSGTSSWSLICFAPVSISILTLQESSLHHREAVHWRHPNPIFRDGHHTSDERSHLRGAVAEPVSLPWLSRKIMVALDWRSAVPLMRPWRSR